MDREHAFSLIELMVTLAVLAISLMIAVPSFIGITRSNRTTTETNALVGALNFARSEATKRGTTVSICTSNDGATCATGIGWAKGWIVFVDNNTMGQVDTGDSILRVYGAISPGNTISPSAALANFITYGASGFSSGQGQFMLCNGSGTSSARAINVTRTGRIYLQTGVGKCTAS